MFGKNSGAGRTKLQSRRLRFGISTANQRIKKKHLFRIVGGVFRFTPTLFDLFETVDIVLSIVKKGEHIEFKY